MILLSLVFMNFDMCVPDNAIKCMFSLDYVIVSEESLPVVP